MQKEITSKLIAGLSEFQKNSINYINSHQVASESALKKVYNKTFNQNNLNELTTFGILMVSHVGEPKYSLGKAYVDYQLKVKAAEQDRQQEKLLQDSVKYAD